MIEEFATFIQVSGIKQIKCVTCHLASIGTVEHLVQILKNIIKSSKGNLRKPLLDSL